MVTSSVVNVTVLILLCLIGAAAKKVHDKHVLLATLTEPIPVKKAEEKPKPKPKVPEPPKIEPPKIEQPKLEMPKIQQVKLDMPKPPTPQVHMDVKLPVLAAAPLKVNAPPAPRVIANLNPHAAAVPNNDRHPSPVMVGTLNNPLKVDPNSRTTTKINMGNQGVPGMPAGNTGHGPRSLVGTMGSGAPNGYDVNGKSRAAVAVQGLTTGVPGGQGHARTTTAVAIAPMVTQQAAQVQHQPVGETKPISVTSKPVARCTDDAKKNHIEGQVSVSALFSAHGTVQILGIVRGLGHGLDQEAEAVVRGIQFKPSTVGGQPIDQKTVINVMFACSPQ
jgi:TonB family protein